MPDRQPNRPVTEAATLSERAAMLVEVFDMRANLFDRQQNIIALDLGVDRLGQLVDRVRLGTGRQQTVELALVRGLDLRHPPVEIVDRLFVAAQRQPNVGHRRDRPQRSQVVPEAS